MIPLLFALLSAAGLETQFRELAARQGPLWIAYEVPSVPGHSPGCDGRSDKVYLEGARRMRVLYRITQGKPEKIRVVAVDCQIDAGGLPLETIPAVKPAESVALLESLTTPGGKLAGSAVTALALHDDAAAEAALDRLTAPGTDPRLREKAVFWLGAARGRTGYERLRRIVRDDADDRVRERAVFALHVSKQPEAVDAVIAVARNDKSPKVRGQALFWLAQKAGKRAVETIGDAMANDPDTAVKKRAVFALHQLPGGEGVPKLIEVARTSRNPEVRKQAMFWLGQSRDPRALAFFESVLK